VLHAPNYDGVIDTNRQNTYCNEIINTKIKLNAPENEEAYIFFPSVWIIKYIVDYQCSNPSARVTVAVSKAYIRHLH